MNGNRAFWALVTAAVVIRATVVFLACCLMIALSWQITHHGADVLRSGRAWAGAALLTLSAVGTARSARRLWHGLRAARTVDVRLRTLSVDESPAVRATVRKAGLTARVEVVEDTVPFAFTHGLLRPRVAVSSGLVTSATSAELQAVLAHEAEHARGRDPLRTLIANVLAVRHFTLPLLEHLRTVFSAERELAADRCAVTHCGVGAVAGALLKVGGTPQWAHNAPAAAMGGRSLLEARIRQLEGKDAPYSARAGRLQVALTAAGGALHVWAIAGSAWLVATTPLACMFGGH
ncbi:M56 family metallopeptidase [Streptomyces sp. NPDC001406]|uniref:M56 family metallopeptidase n=1 Tax=Streptomyces sp. NPDC001406 TaxID=3364572 RepID=UPI00368C0903